MLHKVLLACWAGTQISGWVLASLGLLRESFRGVAPQKTDSVGGPRHGGYGSSPPTLQQGLIKLGVSLSLLTVDWEPTLTERRRHAAWAITGITLVAVSILLDVADRIVTP